LPSAINKDAPKGNPRRYRDMETQTRERAHVDQGPARQTGVFLGRADLVKMTVFMAARRYGEYNKRNFPGTDGGIKPVLGTKEQAKQACNRAGTGRSVGRAGRVMEIEVIAAKRN